MKRTASLALGSALATALLRYWLAAHRRKSTLRPRCSWARSSGTSRLLTSASPASRSVVLSADRLSTEQAYHLGLRAVLRQPVEAMRLIGTQERYCDAGKEQ